jgi:hypothetical protein
LDSVEWVLAYLAIFIAFVVGMLCLFYRSMRTKKGIQTLGEKLECLPEAEDFTKSLGESKNRLWLHQLKAVFVDGPAGKDVLHQCAFYHEQLFRHYTVYFESTLLLMFKLLAYPLFAVGIALLLQFVFPKQGFGEPQSLDFALWLPMGLMMAWCLGSFAMLLLIPQYRQLCLLLQPQHLVSLYCLPVEANHSFMKDEMPDCLRLLGQSGFPRNSQWTKIKEAYFQGAPTRGLIEQEAGHAVDHLLKLTKRQSRFLAAWAPLCEAVIGLFAAAWIFLARV